MNKLPDGWKIKKLKDICTIQDGIHKTPKYTSKGIKFVSVENINDLYNSNKFISEEDYNKMYKIKVKKNDIFMTRIGDIGTPAILNKDEKLAYYVTLCLFTNIDEEIFNKYLYYAIQSNYFKKELYHRTLHVAFPKKINLGDIGDCKFILPPLDEQKRIASALSKIDAYLENTIKLIEEKERFKRGIAKKLLTCKEGKNIPEARFKGFEDEWEIVKLKDMFDNFKEKNNEDKIILASTIDKGVIPNSLTERKIIRKKESLSNYKLVKKGCFVISLMSFQSGFEYSDYEGIISPAYTVLKPKIEMAHYFYKYYFKSFKFIKDLRPYAEGIRHGKQIKFKACKDILVPYPSIEEQEKIGGYLSLLDEEIDNLKKQKELIKEMKRGAMQKLLSGEVRLLE